MPKPTPELLAATDFLTEIGLPWHWSPGAKGFIPGVDIRSGALYVCPTARVSGLLHEAGHLACLPGDFRPLAQRNMSGVQKLMLDTLDFGNPDGELERAAMQCSDPEATAWAWAAGEHLGLKPRAIIWDDEYANSGAELRGQLLRRQYVGIHGLAHAGFCSIRPGALADRRGIPAFPKMVRWLQKDFGHAGAAAIRAAQFEELAA